MTLNGAGIGSTIFDGKGKISSATTYHGINLSGIAAGTVTISNLKIGGYYNGIERTSATASAASHECASAQPAADPRLGPGDANGGAHRYAAG